MWHLWHNDEPFDEDDEDENEEDGYYDESSANVVVVRLLGPRDGTQAGRRAAREAHRKVLWESQLSVGVITCHSAYFPQQAWPTDTATGT